MLKMLDIPTNPAASRRGFLMGAAAVSGAFVLGFALPGKALAQGKAAASPFGGYIVIAPDGKVTVLAAHMEMGQGIHHGIGTLVAEELGVPLAQVTVEGGAGNTALYGNLTMGGAFQLTGGSTGAPSSWDRYRQAGATAREMLRMAAAQAWGVPLAQVTAANGQLAAPGGKSATYGAMAEAAAKIAPPADVALKSPDQWALIGNDQTTRIAGRDKVTGRQMYTIDIALPGMLTAVIAHPPRFGARLRSFDAGNARQVKGVVDVVQVSHGVAVVAETMWAAIKGREALTIDWDESGAEMRGTAELLDAYRKMLDEPGLTAATRGDAAKVLAGGGKIVEATYEFPYLAHAALEPLNAVVRREGDRLEVWGGHQIPDLYQQTAAAIAGLKPEQVTLHVMTTGGGFGRRAVPDADIIVEAVEIAKAINWRAPVKLQWTREDDMAGGRYRPLFVHRVKAAVGKDGRIAAWHHRIVGQSILIGSPFEMMVKNGVDESSVEGASDIAYTVPNLHVAVSNAKAGVPVLWWRSVGHTHTAFAVETMMDALAQAAGQDPIAFRLAHLPKEARERGVLELAAAKAGWGKPVAAGVHRGVAVHKSFNSYVAMIADVTMPDPKTVKVQRVIAAVDCGVPINPDVIRAQVEGGIGFGLGAALHSELTLTEGKVDQGNYDAYQVLRMEDMPEVEVHIVASAASPTGIGEPGVPPIAPAVANAVAAASGRRIATLPIMKALSA